MPIWVQEAQAKRGQHRLHGAMQDGLQDGHRHTPQRPSDESAARFCCEALDGHITSAHHTHLECPDVLLQGLVLLHRLCKGSLSCHSTCALTQHLHVQAPALLQQLGTVLKAIEAAAAAGPAGELLQVPQRHRRERHGIRSQTAGLCARPACTHYGFYEICRCDGRDLFIMRRDRPAIVLTVLPLALLADLSTVPTSPPNHSCTLGLKQSICNADRHT